MKTLLLSLMLLASTSAMAGEPPGTFTIGGPCYPADEVEAALRARGLIMIFDGSEKMGPGYHYEIWAEFDEWVMVAKTGNYRCYMSQGSTYIQHSEPE